MPHLLELGGHLLLHLGEDLEVAEPRRLPDLVDENPSVQLPHRQLPRASDCKTKKLKFYGEQKLKPERGKAGEYPQSSCKKKSFAKQSKTEVVYYRHYTANSQFGKVYISSEETN